MEDEKATQPTISDIENDFREVLRQIGAEASGLFVSSLQTKPGSEIECECGGRPRYQRMRPAIWISVFGKVARSFQGVKSPNSTNFNLFQQKCRADAL
jgi:hypothetical protein